MSGERATHALITIKTHNPYPYKTRDVLVDSARVVTANSEQMARMRAFFNKRVPNVRLRVVLGKHYSCLADNLNWVDANLLKCIRAINTAS